LTDRRIFFPLVGLTGAVTSEFDPAFHLTGGRTFHPGLFELIASNPCVRQYAGFELGARRSIHATDWTVVGHFDEGDTQQCLVLTDAEILMSTYGSTRYTRVTAMLQSPGDYEALRRALEANPTLRLEVRHERESIENDLREVNALLNFAAYFVGSIMAIGATLGAVNSLYSIVDSRRREIATLRAIGFDSAAIVASILFESILLALPGAVLGAALLSAAAVDFEIPADEPPEASLTPTQIAGESFHIQNPVHSDGLMHHYVVESRFGLFTAYGRDALAVRLREVAALATIAKTSDTEVVLKSVSRGIEEDARSVVQVALNPVGTVIGIPKGIAHLFSGYKAEAGEIAAQVRQTSKGGDSHKKEGGRAAQAEHAARQYADRYLGLSAAERHWYAQLRVDPYTNNEVLRRAVKRLARIDAAASFGVRFAPLGVPFAGEVRRALD